MIIQVHQRVNNFHGEPCAHFLQDQSLYHNAVKKHSYLMILLSPVLFFAPNIHLQDLETIRVDGMVHSVAWRQLMSKLSTEWQEFILYVSFFLVLCHKKLKVTMC